MMQMDQEVIKKKICFVVASQMTVEAFLLQHMKALSELNEVCLVVNTESPGFLSDRHLDIEVIPVAIERSISLIQDWGALLQLLRIFRRRQFDVVHSVTPKAGLLAMTASLLARIRVRIHIFTGQVWVTKKGLSRYLLKSADKMIAAAATHVLTDSPSQKEFLVKEGVVEEEKARVLGHGSISGVDADRFHPDEAVRQAVRREFDISEADVVLLFMGRLNLDKGILDLGRAFAQVAMIDPAIHLLIVGPDESGLTRQLVSICRDCASRLHILDYTNCPERYMAGADIFCLPSYREGFGNVVIEAAATGLPAIATRIYGITDAVEDGVSGLLVEPGDVSSLADNVKQLASMPGLRKKMGANARKRALEKYSSQYVVAEWQCFYATL